MANDFIKNKEHHILHPLVIAAAYEFNISGDDGDGNDGHDGNDGNDDNDDDAKQESFHNFSETFGEGCRLTQ